MTEENVSMQAQTIAEPPNIDASTMPIYIFVKVDEKGYVIWAEGGTSPKPVESDFFFVKDLQTLENIHKFMVVLNGFKADLVLQPGETLEDIQTSPILD